ncbi:restriction endonuclease subunit S [Methylotuvimicrobium sp.]|uniref:restriction endonuclease subunit S n=1 Tax=Methylotuvimicrobium sp. TaxID=2822413 RepID=UPI003D647F3B
MTVALWKTKRLSDLADMCLGKMLDQNKNKGTYLPYLANTNVRWGEIELSNLREMRLEPNEFERYGLVPGDIVMCEGGEPGRCAIWKGQTSSMMIQKALHRIRAKKNVSSVFLYYALLNKGIQGHFDAYFTGAAIKHLTGENLAKIEVLIPPLSIQQKIAAILSAYDDLIENNLKRIKLLEEMAQITYEEWFVRLKFPGHETTPVDPETSLPEGWKKTTLGNCCSLVMGQSPKSEFYNYEKNGLPFHQGVKDYGFRFPENTCWSTDGSRIAKAKDILFSVRAPVGRLNIAIEDIILGRGLSAIRHRNNSQSFLFYQLKQIFFQEDMLGGGAIFASVTKEDMLRIGLIKPDKRTESEFNQFGAAIDQNIENLHRQNQLLKEARDILLPRLMTGMIDVEQLDLPEPLGELSSNLTQEPQAA